MLIIAWKFADNLTDKQVESACGCGGLNVFSAIKFAKPVEDCCNSLLR